MRFVLPVLLSSLCLAGPAWGQQSPEPVPLSEPVPAPGADEEDRGVRLVEAAGVSGTVADALESTLQRFRLAEGADEADEERELRRAERAATETLATEGYFSPTLRFAPNDAATEPDAARYRLLVDTGPLTRVAAVEIEFRGALDEPAFAARAASLRDDWLLPAGSAFRSPDWEAAKARLVQATSARDFAGAVLVSSQAEVDAEAATARLNVLVDSGPAYRIGELRIEGLERFDGSLVRRFDPFGVHDPYDRVLLLEYQQRLQETGFFSSVVITPDLDAAVDGVAPLRVQVIEARTRRFSAGVGYASNTGAHVEALYRQAITFGRPWILQAGFRVDETGEYVYSDLIFPPDRTGARNSIGALFENSEIENLDIRRYGFGASRSRLTGPRDGLNVETQWTINFEHERRETPLDPPITLDVLSTTYTWIRRDVDDVTNPRSGHLLQLQGSVGTGGFSTDDVFFRAFASGVQYLPVGERDTVILRAQVGAVQAESTNVVPNKFLFRTGGSLSVRGYDFESLGVEQGGAIIGGRALAVASAEYVHWPRRWNGEWGIAAFIDAGDAAERFGDLDVALGYGLGVRWRTPAGPLALDVAYGERESQVRVHFSVAIAF